MSRLPELPPESMSQAVREVYERLPVKLAVFRTMAHAETCFRPLLALGTAILGATRLDPRWRELAILRVAALSGARYEWTQHVAIALAVGVSRDRIEAIERGELESPVFDEVERRVLRFTTELVRDVRVSDPTFVAVRERLSDREIVELVLAVGYYMMVARLLETAGLEFEPSGETAVEALERAKQRAS